MKFSHFFIDRPIFASVLSIVILIVGGLALFKLPIAQFPDIVPPTVVVSTAYPGANPQVIADTVAAPIEQEVNGVENMLYMSAQCAGDGSMSLTITFKLGTDIDKAQVQVQNRVAVAEPRLPEEVRRMGVTTAKRSPDITLVVNLISPDGRYDKLYIDNLRLPASERRAGAFARRGSRHRFRRARLRHARLAGSGKNRLARTHRG